MGPPRWGAFYRGALPIEFVRLYASRAVFFSGIFSSKSLLFPSVVRQSVGEGSHENGLTRARRAIGRGTARDSARSMAGAAAGARSGARPAAMPLE